MNTLFRFVALCLTAVTVGAAEKTVVAFNPLEAQGSLGRLGVESSLMLQTELSSSEKLQLVEREALMAALSEMKLGMQGMLAPDSAARIGKITGAQYFCSGSLMETEGRAIAVVKVIQIETTLIRLRHVRVEQKTDPLELGQLLARQIETLVAEFESDRAAQAALVSTNSVPRAIPAEWEKPVVMVLIPEMHVRQPELIDPAAETEIVRRLLAAGFRVQDAEYIAMMKSDKEEARKVFGTLKTAAEHAAKRGAQVLLYGEAVSERGASLGEFEACRGRVELKAVRTADEAILVSDSAEGGATDLSEAIAGKKAIQQAAQRLADRFLYELADAWNRKR